MEPQREQQTTVVGDDVMCTCCQPPQYLVPETDGTYACPITGKKYRYDPALGGAPEPMTEAAPPLSQPGPAQERRDDFFPTPDTGRVTRIAPQDEKFA